MNDSKSTPSARKKSAKQSHRDKLIAEGFEHLTDDERTAVPSAHDVLVARMNGTKLTGTQDKRFAICDEASICEAAMERRKTHCQVRAADGPQIPKAERKIMTGKTRGVVRADHLWSNLLYFLKTGKILQAIDAAYRLGEIKSRRIGGRKASANASAESLKRRLRREKQMV